MQLVATSDFLDPIYKKYSDVDKESIRKVCEYGLRRMVLELEKSYDVIIKCNRPETYHIKTYTHKPLNKHKKRVKRQKIEKLRRRSTIDPYKEQEFYYIAIHEKYVKELVTTGKLKRQRVQVLKKEAEEWYKDVFKVKVTNPTLGRWSFFSEEVRLIK